MNCSQKSDDCLIARIVAGEANMKQEGVAKALKLTMEEVNTFKL